jgi:hypothetical protein
MRFDLNAIAKEAVFALAIVVKLLRSRVGPATGRG